MYFRNLLSMVKKKLIKYYGERQTSQVFIKLNNSAFVGENLLELTKS